MAARDGRINQIGTALQITENLMESAYIKNLLQVRVTFSNAKYAPIYANASNASAY